MTDKTSLYNIEDPTPFRDLGHKVWTNVAGLVAAMIDNGLAVVGPHDELQLAWTVTLNDEAIRAGLNLQVRHLPDGEIQAVALVRHLDGLFTGQVVPPDDRRGYLDDNPRVVKELEFSTESLDEELRQLTGDSDEPREDS